MLRNEKILITGPTSQVALPLARELARDNEVYGLARLSREADVASLRDIGVKPLKVDLAKGSFDAVPDDFTYVVNMAVVKTGSFSYDLAANAEGAGRLAAHCRRAKGFLHVSSGGVYKYAGHRALKEDDQLGDNHQALFPTYSISKIAAETVMRFAALFPTYSISKIAAETVMRFAAQEFGVPTIIARLSVPYGNNGGWPFYHLMMMRGGADIPIHPERPNVYNLLHEDDYIVQIPKLLAAARVPAVTVNWGGEVASIEDWCAYIGQLTGLVPRFQETTEAFGSLELDLTRMHELVGPAQVPWRDGIRRMIEARAPDLLR